jgi:hypothetical protein
VIRARVNFNSSSRGKEIVMRVAVYLAFACLLGIFIVSQSVRAEDKAPAAKSAAKPAAEASDAPACDMCDATVANAQLDSLKKLAGTWVADHPGQDGKPMSIEFKVTANGTAVQETMFPGSAHEMVNMYAMDGDRLLVTHYCAMGVQPRMKLTSADKGVMKFEFVDSTNLKSRDDPHMDSLQVTVDGDKLTEKWSYFEKGKTVSNTEFALKRKSA